MKKKSLYVELYRNTGLMFSWEWSLIPVKNVAEEVPTGKASSSFMFLLKHRTQLMQAFVEDSNSVLNGINIKFFPEWVLCLAALSTVPKNFSAQKYSEHLK